MIALSELQRLVSIGCEIKLGAFKGKDTTVWSAHISRDGAFKTRTVVHATNPASCLESLVEQARLAWPDLFEEVQH